MPVTIEPTHREDRADASIAYVLLDGVQCGIQIDPISLTVAQIITDAQARYTDIELVTNRDKHLDRPVRPPRTATRIDIPDAALEGALRGLAKLLISKGLITRAEAKAAMLAEL